MKNWQVVIPMSGLGSRFMAAGYHDPKPLIEVLGRPMIDWVCRMFPVVDPVFICRRQHIEETNMRAVLEAVRPEGKIIVIDGAKLGPVDALMKASDAIDLQRPLLVSYCDYYMHWDYRGFQDLMERSGAHGAVPCYTGFHPHLIPEKNLYACCRTDDNDHLLEIREKHTFDENKFAARHSPGIYFFDSGQRLLDYSRKLIAANDSLGGEFYVSMIYNHLVADGLKVLAPANIPQFCQWGTPEDLAEFNYWVKIAQRVGRS